MQTKVKEKMYNNYPYILAKTQSQIYHNLVKKSKGGKMMFLCRLLLSYKISNLFIYNYEQLKGCYIYKRYFKIDQ